MIFSLKPMWSKVQENSDNVQYCTKKPYFWFKLPLIQGITGYPEPIGYDNF
jgi:hypothetical protein